MSPLRKTAEAPPPPAPPAGLEALRAALVSADPETRRGAALDLGVLSEPEQGQAISALLTALAVETVPGVRDAVLAQLARHDRPEVAAGLVPYLASEDATVRNAVVGALARIPQAMLLYLPGLIQDQDPDVRILTVMVLAAMDVPEAESWLTRIALHDTNNNAVAAAIGELVPIAGARCVETLATARDRFPQDQFIQFTVRRSLATIAGEGM